MGEGEVGKVEGGGVGGGGEWKERKRGSRGGGGGGTRCGSGEVGSNN